MDAGQLGAMSVETKRELLRSLQAVQAGAKTGVYPLSAGQQALWFVHQIAPNSPAYIFLFAARLPRDTDLAALSRAFGTLVKRHAFLRARFLLHEGRPVQKIEPDLAPTVAHHDAHDLSWDDLFATLRASGDRPFDLATGPAMRMDYFARADETVLLIAFHHLVADLWSMDVLIEELHALYDAERRGLPAALPAVATGFGDYLKGQLTNLHGSRGKAAVDYWSAELGGELPVLDLPTDRPRPPVQTFACGNVSWPLAPESVKRLEAFAASVGTTTMPALLTAYQLFLQRLASQEDVLVGVATADRGRPEWDRLVGYMLNQVVVRNAHPGTVTYRQALDATRAKLYRGLEHQEHPFGDIVRRLSPRRDPSRSAVVQTMFIWDRPRALPFPHRLDLSRPPASEGGKLVLEPLLLEQRGDSFDLTMIVFDGGTDLTARFSYNAALFDRATVEAFAARFDRLLDQLTRHPDTPLCELDLLSDDDRAKLDSWATTPRPEFVSDELFLRRVERLAREHPESAAVVFESTTLTYADLDGRANRLARVFLRAGLTRGDVVALHLPRSPEMIVAMFAVWKAGGAWLFLDPAYPPARLAAMADDAAPFLIVADADHKTAASQIAPRVRLLCLDDGSIPFDAITTEPVDATVSADDRAYVIYTSGSTGTPKGTLLTHRGIGDLADGMGRVVDVRPGDRFLQFASASFDAAVSEIAMALGHGAALVMARQTDLLPGPGLVRLLETTGVTHAVLPPSILAAVPVSPLPMLRALVTAGEPCPAELMARWATPGRKLFNAYGPTETTVCATMGDVVFDGRTPDIGTPIGRMRLSVVDRDLNRVAPGVVGELLIGGPGLAEGYLNRPELTAEKFVPDAFSGLPGERLYRTGDHVRYRADGRLDFLGRIDHQVKLRGHRIELDEIAETLRAHEAVSDAAVLMRTDAGKAPALAAYVVPADGREASVDVLRGHLRAALPPFMVPATITALPRMPTTVNGKIDRAALMRIVPQVGTSARHEPPRNDTEAALAEVWGAVLGVAKVGVHDNFFDLGGASLQTVEVVERAAAKGLALTPELVFRNQTVAELAAALGAPAAVNADAAPDAAAGVGLGGGRDVGPTVGGGALIESLAAYLPPRAVSTDDVLKGCRVALDFPLERFTGIKSRRMAGEDEFAIDLAAKALQQCFARSRYGPEDIDMVVCCNISRYDGPFFRFSLEPTTAARLKQRFGLTNALAFDVSNACAGTFTSIGVVDAFLRAGLIRRALVVSGEYITHLTQTAQMEIKDFMDPRLACLTVGDAGVAVLLERATTPNTGMSEVELFTLGRYHPLCTAGMTHEAHGGAIMFTDPVKSAVVTTKLLVSHTLEMLERNHWTPEGVNHLVMHQTSERTLDGAVQEINRLVGRTVVGKGNVVYNLAHRGNCATNTHLLAAFENMQAGKIRPGDNAVFAVSGSGLTVGSALYTFDELPERIRSGSLAHPAPGRHRPDRKGGRGSDAEDASRAGATGERSPVNGGDAAPSLTVGPVTERGDAAPSLTVGPVTERKIPRDAFALHRLAVPAAVAAVSDAVPPASSTDMMRAAGEQAIARAQQPREDIDLILHTGVYHTDFLCEPAMATIAAGELGINHDDEKPTGKRTLAFDVLSGGTGTLTACFVAAGLMQGGRCRRALVLASEVENNANVRPEHLLGLRQTATGMILTPGDGVGFAAFGFRGFPEHVERRSTWTGAHDYKPAAFHHCDADLDAIYAECLLATVGDFLAAMNLSLADVGAVLPPWRSPAFVALLSEKLGDKVLPMPDVPGDLFTSSLACTLAEATRRNLPGPWLVLEVGSGVQAACALYQPAKTGGVA